MRTFKSETGATPTAGVEVISSPERRFARHKPSFAQHRKNSRSNREAFSTSWESGKSHYSSSPHLFVFQGQEETDNESLPPERHSESVTPPKQVMPRNSVEADDVVEHFNAKYATPNRPPIEKSNSLDLLSLSLEDRFNLDMKDPYKLSEAEVSRMDAFFRGHKTEVFVCRTMANLYLSGATVTTPPGSVVSGSSGKSSPASSNGSNYHPHHQSGSAESDWEWKFTGVPVMLLDCGNTKNRSKRRLQFILAEQGSGFPLFTDTVDNLTDYRLQTEGFHTFHFSKDHRIRIGLSFDDTAAASDFYDCVQRLCNNPENISLKGPRRKTANKQRLRFQRKRQPDHVTDLVV
ncbi:unnamed protein product [Cyprideis torosa]|uniref:Uncharacterized protein n=1 Tax=Cyprideis torosa TaxID=163714 RepID=A0A7R8WGT7_9CRUS|nr:unnamed protein product [Cyprideis torosa]CAG0898595.1 unnamed protein product [Cyprideis torosa]